METESHHHHETVATLDRRFFHWVSCLLLLLWGGVLLYYFASGRIVHYLTGNGAFHLQCLLGGLGLCVLGGFNLLTSRRRYAHPHDHVGGDCCGHGATHHSDDAPHAEAPGHEAEHEHAQAHEHGHETAPHPGPGHGPAGEGGGWLSKSIAFAILALPVTAAAIYSPDRYSEEFKANMARADLTSRPRTIGGGAIDVAQRAEQAKPAPGTEASTATLNPNAFTVAELERLSGGRTPEGNIRLQLVELFYMPAQTEDVKEVVAAETLETVGQAIKDKADPSKLRLFRLMMTCCAADARPISVPVEFDGPAPEWREMSWYKVVGKVEYRDVEGTPTAVFKATALTPEKPPRNQMMY